MLRRRVVLGVFGLVSVARLSRLFEAPEAPPGQELVPLLEFLRATIPAGDGFLYVLPGAFGADTGTGPRLRYELYPRRYDDVRAAVDDATVHQLMQSTGLRFVVVPDASLYPASHWLRQPPAWLRRLDFNANSFLLELVV